MFSRIRYFSGKSWPKGDRIPAGFLFLVVMMFVLLAIDPPTVMMLIGLIYVGSGLVVTLLGRQKWKSRRFRRSSPKEGDPLKGGPVIPDSKKDDGHDDPGGPKG
jgi:hypothetical protein